MLKRGHENDELVAKLATSAAMSETIPPSLVLITIGSVADVSMADLFTGGLVPAFVLCLALAALSRDRFTGDDRRSTPPRHSARTIASTLVIALPALALPFVIRAAVVEGVATATEVVDHRHRLCRGRSGRWSTGASSTGAGLFPHAGRDGVADRRHPVRLRRWRRRWRWALTQSGFSQPARRR